MKDLEMTYTTPEGIPSGMPHRVTSVAGLAPSQIEEFVGETEFVIDRQGAEYMIRGCGVRDDNDVLFSEKDLEHDGKDMRIWQIWRGGEGYEAAQKSMF